MTILYGGAAVGATLPRAVQAAGLVGGCALLTAPSAHHVARVEEHGCATPTGPVDLSCVYEARVFTPKVELRWVEAGYAVLLTEDRSLLPAFFGESVAPLSAVATPDAHYLLWGEVGAPASDGGRDSGRVSGKAEVAAQGWVTLRSARIGTLTVPMAPFPVKNRVRLVAREYVVADEVHGNAYVAEERLMGFEPYAPEEDA
ncbi:CRISPR-associated protein Csx19 [Streptosporangium sp. NPDC049078]|uniref:type III-D CRISPR-associated protein Csx19 n=1 Tax=Streptosporangium sp. NPDC049078 TaxID=3155767 RepID=UPI003445AF91